MVSNQEIAEKLRDMAVNTGTLNCLGCGFEHNCSVHGCAVLKQAAELILAKRLTDVGCFKASGDLALCRCPFCGSEDVVYERYLHTAGYRWRVVCTSCMASIDPGYAQQRSTVQRMWNTRAPILSAAEMEMLEGME